MSDNGTIWVRVGRYHGYYYNNVQVSIALYVGLTFDSIIAGQSNLNNEVSTF